MMGWLVDDKYKGIMQARNVWWQSVHIIPRGVYKMLFHFIRYSYQVNIPDYVYDGHRA